ncbi:YraN family protein [Marinospirillum alkaliphilum]|uniref:UPF0102 protein SAMN02745752_00270 n=1 Tax=Marinospirillum alkaliphilum DSM 21637 TaxID=1122209 RepID=A0A1K1TRD4_9GAMM|nr:YraN family protein [Marinospirillum alkaliphilum]SFX02821.1 putative endonuclease [Marinospirillum alkaliphilum DSM 21637]
MKDQGKISRQIIGQQAEAVACSYLLNHGLQLVEKNFRCRMGEIDLIMRDGQQLVFVEVRFRSSSAYGGAAASINHNKQLKLQRAAAFYLGRLNTQPACRFDAVTLSPDSSGNPLCDNWIKNAF